MKKILIFLSIIIVAFLTGCDFLSVKYTLYFDSNGGTEVTSITTDGYSIIQFPENPTKEGYVFEGWFWDDEIFLEPLTANSLLEEPISSDMTLYAKWVSEETTNNLYVVTFDTAGGSTIDSQAILYGSKVVEPYEPTKLGYLFYGWYKDELYIEEWDFNLDVVKEDILIYAKWEVATADYYIVTYITNCETMIPSIQVYKDTSISPPSIELKGYTLDGWYISLDNGQTLSEKWSFVNGRVNSNITLYAKWIINQYTLSFEINGGNAIEDIVQNYSTIISSPEVYLNGYSFSGWFLDEELTEEYYISTMPAEDITLYAKWSINQYTIIFDSNKGSLIDSITEDYGKDIFQPTDPIREGYNFIGWFNDEELTIPYTFVTMPAEDITLYAKWNINQYTLSFETNGGNSISEITQDFESNIYSPEDPVRVGYVFNGWYTTQDFTVVYIFNLMPAEDITLYAKWSINTYSLQYIDEDGTVLFSEQFNFNSDLSPIISPAEPEKEGYTFNGWSIELPLYMPADNVILQATYNINQYSINFETNGGTSINEITDDYNTTLNLQEPEKEDFIFGGWFVDEDFITLFEGTTIPSRDITLYAKWIDIIYQITFDSSGGSAVEGIGFVRNTIVDFLPVPILEDYVFEGWYYGEVLIETPHNFTYSQDITLVAEWRGYSKGLSFEIIDEIAVITGYDGDETTLVIPDYLGGYSVEIIGEDAFKDNNTLTYIDLGNNITTIENGSFQNLMNLTEIVMNHKTIIIANDSFSGTYGISKMTISSELQTTFQNLWGTTPSTLEHIKLADGSIFISLQLGQSHFGSAAFEFADDWSKIENIPFSSETYIEKLIIPNTITLIDDFEFTDMSSLVEIVFEENSSLILIGLSNFKGTSIESIIIPASVTRLCSQLFYEVTTLTDVYFEEGSQLQIINSQAFYGTSITTFILPATVTQIDSNAFAQISTLKSFYFEKGSQLAYIPDHMFFGSHNLVKIELPSTITSLGPYSFANTGVVNFVIPDSVTEILNYAFYRAFDLESIYIPNTVNIVGFGTFTDISVSDSIILIEAHELPDGWNANWNANHIDYILDYTGNGLLYELSFNTNIEESIDDLSVIHRLNTDLPIPELEGYTFIGWYYDEELTTPYTFATMPAEDITLYAKWNITTYNIIYELYSGVNGTNPDTYTVETSTITLDNPSKVGYTFNGWFNNAEFAGDEVTEITLGSTEDITLYAKWNLNIYENLKISDFLNFDTETINFIFNSETVLNSISTQISNLYIGENYDLVVPEMIFDDNGYVNKIDFQNFVTAVKVLATQLRCDLINETCLENIFNIGTISSLSNLNFDALVASSIMHATLSNLIISLDGLALTIPTNDINGTTIRYSLAGNSYITKLEIRVFFDAMDVLGIGGDLGSFNGSLGLTNLFETNTEDFDDNQETVLLSAIMHRTITDQIEGLDGSGLTVPTSDIGGTSISTTVGPNFFINKLEIKSLFNAMDAMGLTGGNLGSFDAGAVDLANLANDDSGKQTTLLTSAIMHATVSQEFLGTTLIVPDVDINRAVGIRVAAGGTEFIEDTELKALLSGLNQISLTGFGSMNLSITDIYNADLAVLLSSATMQASVSDELIPNGTTYSLATPGEFIIPLALREDIAVATVATKWIEKNELIELIEAFDTMGLNGFDVSIDGSSMSGYSEAQIHEILESASMHLTVEKMIKDNDNINTFVPDIAGDLVIHDSYLSIAGIISSTEVEDFILAVNAMGASLSDDFDITALDGLTNGEKDTIITSAIARCKLTSQFEAARWNANNTTFDSLTDYETLDTTPPLSCLTYDALKDYLGI